MRFALELAGIPPVNALSFELDLAQNRPLCIVGKNGCGKTTLAKAILNLALADTFRRTSSDSVLHEGSTIRYTFGEEEFLFSFDSELGTLNCKEQISTEIKQQISVELPIPYGQRFNMFGRLSAADHQIRRAIILKQYRKPEELIRMLARIYGESRFEDLVEVQVQGIACCCILLPSGRYLREDYFSSGEYFLINLYRKVLERQRLIVIDEIDISLDAAAQARLVPELRSLCALYSVNIVFMSHSLAMMQTLEPGELVLMERNSIEATLTPRSFGYVKSLLFGFSGNDKYILTEDAVLRDFLLFIIHRYCPPSFFSYSIIEVAGAAQVVDLMRRNRTQGFLGHRDNVISILDGDQHDLGHAQADNTFCIPLANVEQAFWDEHSRANFQPKIVPEIPFPKIKALYKYAITQRILSSEQIFNLLCNRHDVAIRQFANTLEVFLGRAEKL